MEDPSASEVEEAALPNANAGMAGMPDSILDGLGEAMSRLQDPYNYDHTSLERMLSKYKTRDLEKSKLYRLAKGIFGDRMDPKAKQRNRIFVLTDGLRPRPVVNAGLDERKRCDSDAEFADVSDVRLLNAAAVPASADMLAENDTHAFGTTSSKEVSEYRKWIDERKELRHGLDHLGLNEQWLTNKPQLSQVEADLLREMVSKRLQKQLAADKPTMEVEEVPAKPRVTGVIPLIRRPSPLAIRTLESYLTANRMRLLDIFAEIDKQKAWKVSKADFLKTIKEHDLPISESLLGDLIMTLDVSEEGMLNYKSLAKGLSLWRLEKRESKSRGSDILSDGDSVFEPVPSSSLSQKRRQRAKSGASTVSSASTMLLLEPPPPDLRKEAYIMSSPEEQADARKRDLGAYSMIKRMGSGRRRPGADLGARQGPAPIVLPHGSVFKTGYRPVDEHCRSSTLGGDTAEGVDSFRQLKLKEYYEIVNLCQRNGIILSRDLLDRVLLHPGDKPTRLLLKQGIRQPGTSVPLSRHFADPPKRPRTPIEIRNKHKMKRNEKGELLIDYKHLFPPTASVNLKPERVELSTGKAFVGRRIDCWMTFEEYEKLVSDYKVRYVKLHGSSNDGAFWPGHLLDKMRLVFDGDRTSEPSNALFHRVRAEPRHNYGYDNDLNNWPYSDGGYLLQGSLRHPKTL